MQQNQQINEKDIKPQQEKKDYKAPQLIRQGKVEEMTQDIPTSPSQGAPV